MTIPLTIPPSHQPVAVDPFLHYSQKGLFAAPWLGQPDPLEIMAVQRLSRNLSHTDLAHADWTPVMSQLLEVRGDCLLAAQAGNPLSARARYQDALAACRKALDMLHHATEATGGALAAWAQGVHALILAQLAMPNLAETERLAREAAVHLSGVQDPLCAGAEEDAHAATLLAREPHELTRNLVQLPDRMLDKIEYFRHERDRQESELNQLLSGVRSAHTTSFRSVTVWVAINLALMATLPLNGVLAPDIPWSLPLVIAVPVFWWLTWDRPYREGMRFFDYLNWRKAESLARFHEYARGLAAPVAQFRESATALLRDARRDRERLAAYHLFALPGDADTIDDAAGIAADGRDILAGEWMIELSDTSPWRLDEALAVEPSLLPRGNRIYLDGDAAE